MKADIDFRPYICEAIRINGWDDPEKPTTPDMLRGDKDCKLNDLFLRGRSLQYEITPEDFMLVNGHDFSVRFYTVDDDGNLRVIPKPDSQTKTVDDNNSPHPDSQDDMFITVADLLAKKDPVSWLITDWIPQGKGLLQLYGASGTGKSFLVLDWMLSVITGQKDWKGFSCNPGHCLYLAGEGQRGVAKRIKAWLQHHGLDYKTENRILSENGLVLSSKALLSLDDKKQFDEMQNMLDKRNFIPDLIIIDTMNRFQSGDENSTRDATAFVHACDELAGKYSCAVLLVHHVGWASEAQNRARGSSVVHSSVDMDFQLKDSSGVLVLSQEKNKDFEKSQPLYLALESVQIRDDFPESSAVLVKAEKPEDDNVKDVTRQNDEVLCLEAFKAFGVDHNGVVSISIEDFKKYCKGKLTDRKGKPYEGTTFTNQFNPNQGKFIRRLLNYRVVEIPEDNKRRLRLIDTALLFLFNSYQKQQPNLDG